LLELWNQQLTFSVAPGISTTRKRTASRSVKRAVNSRSLFSQASISDTCGTALLNSVKKQGKCPVLLRDVLQRRTWTSIRNSEFPFWEDHHGNHAAYGP